MIEEVYGDATRGGEWRAVRLRVDGDRVVESDAEGLEGPLAGHAARIGAPA